MLLITSLAFRGSRAKSCTKDEDGHVSLSLSLSGAVKVRPVTPFHCSRVETGQYNSTSYVSKSRMTTVSVRVGIYKIS